METEGMSKKNQQKPICFGTYQDAIVKLSCGEIWKLNCQDCPYFKECQTSKLPQDKRGTIMETEIREYAEGEPVEIREAKAEEGMEHCEEGRLVISARNEGGYNGTLVDLLDVMEWVKKNMPELLDD